MIVRTARIICVTLLVIALLASAGAQYRREPLTDKEIDQLRDAAQEPSERMKLYVTFARDRLAALEQMRGDPKVKDRADQTHDKLQNFLDVYDELNGNIDTFVERKADLRKPLKNLIEADTEFQARLQALKTSADANPEEERKYEFLLATAVDTLSESLHDHQQLLSEQEVEFRKKKK